MEGDKKIEIFLGMIFLIFVFMMILFVLCLNGMNEPKKIVHVQKKVINNNQINYNFQENNYYKDNSKFKKKSHKINSKYHSYGKKEKEEFFDTYANDFKVYLKNKGEGKYYTVRFYFENSFGEEKIIDMRKYVFSEETEIFHFRDISKGKNEYRYWKYKIIEE